MQYRTDVPTARASIYDTPGHSLAQAASDDISGLVESMRTNGFDPACPIIIAVGDHTKARAGWQWNGDDQMEIVQGRHRWLAAIEAGLDEVCAIALGWEEWEALRAHGDANDVEDALRKHIDAFLAIADEDEELPVDLVTADFD